MNNFDSNFTEFILNGSIDNKSALLQVMACCHQATSPCLKQCWSKCLAPYGIVRPQWVNSLAPGRSKCNSKNVIFNLVVLIGIFRTSHDNALRWMPQDLTDKSTLVQVMAWYCQATSHYLSQCWLSSLSPYGVARSQWVKSKMTAVIKENIGTPWDLHVSNKHVNWWSLLGLQSLYPLFLVKSLQFI